jgi:hypothetical protein
MRKLNLCEGATALRACALAFTSCATVALWGCATNDGYRQAFSDQGRIAGNSHPISADPATTLRAALIMPAARSMFSTVNP